VPTPSRGAVRPEEACTHGRYPARSTVSPGSGMAGCERSADAASAARAGRDEVGDEGMTGHAILCRQGRGPAQDCRPSGAAVALKMAEGARYT